MPWSLVSCFFLLFIGSAFSQFIDPLLDTPWADNSLHEGHFSGDHLGDVWPEQSLAFSQGGYGLSGLLGSFGDSPYAEDGRDGSRNGWTEGILPGYASGLRFGDGAWGQTQDAGAIIPYHQGFAAAPIAGWGGPIGAQIDYWQGGAPPIAGGRDFLSGIPHLDEYRFHLQNKAMKSRLAQQREAMRQLLGFYNVDTAGLYQDMASHLNNMRNSLNSAVLANTAFHNAIEHQNIADTDVATHLRMHTY